MSIIQNLFWLALNVFNFCFNLLMAIQQRQLFFVATMWLSAGAIVYVGWAIGITETE